MNDDLLLEYAFNTLPPADRAAVEAHLATHQADAAKVLLARRVLRPLQSDREAEDPPNGLALATLERTAEYLVVHGIPPAEPRIEPAVPRKTPSQSDLDLSSPGWRRLDVVIAAGIAFLAFGLLFAGIGKVRQRSQVLACQNNLRGLHGDLVNYSEAHDGRFPAVGTPAVPVAGAYGEELARNGFYPAACPSTPPDDVPNRGPVYAYTLGYLGADGSVRGLRRGDGPDAAPDGVPVAADLLPNRAGISSHANGQNVLFAGGAVRFARTSTVGVNGDEIYRNDAGLVRAGLHRDDASLGRAADYP